MNRVKLNVVGNSNMCSISNINDDFIGLLSYDVNGRYLFVVNPRFALFNDLFEKNNIGCVYLQGSYEHAIEKINMLLEKYINRFFEKE